VIAGICVAFTLAALVAVIALADDPFNDRRQ